MARFIFITFGFLGWAFFEMSGGTNFDPDAYRLARAAEAESDSQTVVAERSTAATSPRNVERRQPLVTQAAFASNTTMGASVTPALLNLTTRVPVQKAVARDDDRMPNAKANGGSVVSSADTPAIILPSLIGSAQAGTVQKAALESDTGHDLRVVSGDRVNVRGGPGTKYSIVNKMSRGDEVEILRDNGNGWVKLRPVDGGPVGWMADFLLADS
ncbi:SH3 domain-containing protein [Sulfitobacter aestuarii]|uniref:SH3 domain-containing protein n=1 Tax=Sulfitobacter aestuarii TaxID=2161676 RepID=A0ABW5TXC8_9RHOB